VRALGVLLVLTVLSLRSPSRISVLTSFLGWCSKLNARATASLCLQGGGGENKRSSRHNVVSIEATRNGPHETVSVCGWIVYVFKCATKPLQLNHCLLVGRHASAKQSNVSHKGGVFTEYCIWYVQTRPCVRQVLCSVEIAAGERSGNTRMSCSHNIGQR